MKKNNNTNANQQVNNFKITTSSRPLNTNTHAINSTHDDKILNNNSNSNENFTIIKNKRIHSSSSQISSSSDQLHMRAQNNIKKTELFKSSIDLKF